MAAYDFRVRYPAGRNYWSRGETAYRNYLVLCDQGWGWVVLEEWDQAAGRWNVKASYDLVARLRDQSA